MTTINVNLAEKSYDIQIGAGLLKQVPESLSTLGFGQKAVIITNPLVQAPIWRQIKRRFEGGGPDSMQPYWLCRMEKCTNHWNRPVNYTNNWLNFRPNGITPIIALGGGVIGDSGRICGSYLHAGGRL